ncbi:MAG: SDR family oxidoreductase [Rickettsiales bacterium TMED289]|nr:MAG: SDR family oxidoreductase [Rickettsiales bacterium TMED289]|tara:strand:+ start:3571 stop:4347 length:777 start_codon:yes stop_codon:yes gene_type:complete
MINTRELNKKNILIFGGTGLIGKELVKEFLSFGSKIISVDIDSEALKIQKKLYKNKNYHSLYADITNLDSLRSVFDYSIEEVGTIDAAINLAYPKNSEYGNEFWDVSYQSFSENVSKHLGGYFLIMQQCAKYSIENNRPFSLVNFASIYGSIAPKFDIYKKTTMTMPIEYAAIKASIIHLSSYVAAYTKGSEFRVNCISPGGILDGQDEEFLENYKAYSRTKGMLNPEDLIGAVAFLCSDSSKFVCGQNIVVDDGFSL